MPNLDDSEYYASLSNKQLIQVASDINKEKHPNRYKLVNEELYKRQIAVNQDGTFTDPNGNKDPGGPSGIGGWLLFFCLSVTLGSIVQSFSLVSDLFIMFENHTFNIILILYAFLTAVFICFGGFAVFNLVKGGKDAVSLVKAYLLFSIGFVFITFSVAVLQVYGDPRVSLIEFTINYFKIDGLKRIIYYLLWFQYFRKSSRVANTYESAKAIIG